MQQKSNNIFYNPTVIKKVTRRNLPHWNQSEKMYFTTFRTADSMPQDEIEVLRQERQQWQQNRPKPYNEKEKAEYRLLFSEKMNAWLDNCHGECFPNFNLKRNNFIRSITPHGVSDSLNIYEVYC